MRGGDASQVMREKRMSNCSSAFDAFTSAVAVNLVEFEFWMVFARWEFVHPANALPA